MRVRGFVLSYVDRDDYIRRTVENEATWKATCLVDETTGFVPRRAWYEVGTASETPTCSLDEHKPQQQPMYR